MATHDETPPEPHAGTGTDTAGRVFTVIGEALTRTIRWPEVGEAPTTTLLGGAGALVAVAAAPLATVRFIGQVGADPEGDHLLAVLGAAGVERRVSRIGSTGRCEVTHGPDGEVTVRSDRATADALEVIPAAHWEGLQMLYVSAGVLGTEPMRSTVLDVVSAVQVLGVQVVLDLVDLATVHRLGAEAVHTLLGQVGPHVVVADPHIAALFRWDRDAHPSVGVHLIIDAGTDADADADGAADDGDGFDDAVGPSASVGVWVPDVVRQDFTTEWTRCPQPALAHEPDGRELLVARFCAARLAGAPPVDALRVAAQAAVLTARDGRADQAAAAALEQWEL